MIPRYSKRNIAAVIVNWNKKNNLLKLIGQLKKISISLDMIVVDNASTDGSVASVKNDFPDVRIIANRKNYGGTGGFNTGIKYVIKQNKYDYLWLLDNDVEIRNDTLSELVKILESDNKIGMVGSRIIDIENSEITVETGGNLRCDIVGVTPLNRNTAEKFLNTSFVDYVAICSALVRVSALNKTGLMDSRMFLLWDDMDWGICFNKKGFKVAASSDSIVYHGSFTERDRGEETYYYYNIRNPLLLYSKHTGIFKLSFILYFSLRYYMHIYWFFRFNGRFYEAKLIYRAISDYLNSRWGRLRVGNSRENNSRAFFPSDTIKPVLNNILVSTIGTSLKDSSTIIKTLNEHFPGSRITTLVTHDRENYYNNFKKYILNKSKFNNIMYMAKEFIKIKRLKYDAIVFITPTPLNYAGKNILFLNRDGEIISLKRSNFSSLFFLGLGFLFAESLTNLLFPLLFIKSLMFKNGGF